MLTLFFGKKIVKEGEGHPEKEGNTNMSAVGSIGPVLPMVFLAPVAAGVAIDNTRPRRDDHGHVPRRLSLAAVPLQTACCGVGIIACIFISFRDLKLERIITRHSGTACGYPLI